MRCAECRGLLALRLDTPMPVAAHRRIGVSEQPGRTIGRSSQPDLAEINLEPEKGCNPPRLDILLLSGKCALLYH
jgi:hypothetical protein